MFVGLFYRPYFSKDTVQYLFPCEGFSCYLNLYAFLLNFHKFYVKILWRVWTLLVMQLIMMLFILLSELIIYLQNILSILELQLSRLFEALCIDHFCEAFMKLNRNKPKTPFYASPHWSPLNNYATRETRNSWRSILLIDLCSAKCSGFLSYPKNNQSNYLLPAARHFFYSTNNYKYLFTLALLLCQVI